MDRVYCEKPLTRFIEEGKTLVRAARKTNRIVQCGSQQRSEAKFLKAAEYVRNGRIGKIKRVLVGLVGVNWTKDPLVPDSEPPAELDYDMWLGPAPARPCHLGNIAVRTGRKIQWDPAKEMVVGDTEAAKLTTKEYRAPWKLPRV